MMGLFSIYTGLVYNDIFSHSMALFTSRYDFTRVNGTHTWLGVQTGTYGFGLDPAWHGAENQLIFLNSYKMKMAIVFGVVHVTCNLFVKSVSTNNMIDELWNHSAKL
jgi:V-type H+-transporting ATPase subunit a